MLTKQYKSIYGNLTRLFHVEESGYTRLTISSGPPYHYYYALVNIPWKILQTLQDSTRVNEFARQSFSKISPHLNQSLKHTLGPATCDLLVSRIGNLEATLLLCRVSHILHRGSYCISTAATMSVSAGVLFVWRVIRLPSVVCRGVHYQTPL